MTFKEKGSPRRTAFHSAGREIYLHLATIVRVLVRAGQRLTFNSGHVAAAAIAYYGLVSLFPLVLLLLSVLGFVFPVTTLAERLVGLAADLLPGSADFFRQSLLQLVVHRGSLGLTALVTLYWSASGAFISLSRTLDLVWETPVNPDPDAAFLGPVRMHPMVGVWRRVRALGIVLGVGLLFLLSVVSTTYLHVAETLDLLSLVPVLATAAVFLGLYALIPRRPPPWRALWPGTVAATVLFEVAKGSFAWYAAHLRRYAWVYGSVTTTIVLMVWFYVAAVIIIYGAEVGAVVRARAFGPLGRGRGKPARGRPGSGAQAPAG